MSGAISTMLSPYSATPIPNRNEWRPAILLHLGQKTSLAHPGRALDQRDAADTGGQLLELSVDGSELSVSAA